MSSELEDSIRTLDKRELVVRLYDADHPPEHARFRSESSHLLDRLQNAPGRILELCCGTGRVLMELARAGFEVTGIDIDAAALARARGKLEAEGVEGNLVDLIEGDILEVDPGPGYGAVVIALSSIMCLGNRDRQRSLVKKVGEILGAGGLFYLESLDPALCSREASLESLRAVTYGERWLDLGDLGGISYRKRQLCWGIDDEGAEKVAIHYELGGVGRIIRRVSQTWRWRWLPPAECRSWLAEEGLEIEECAEGFGGRGSYIIVARNRR